jgi:hypothetical protein
MAGVIIVEQVYDPPLTDEEHTRMSARIDQCLQLRNARWVRSYLSDDRRRMVCEFEAPDAQSVRDAYHSAGASAERIWGSTLYKRE